MVVSYPSNTICRDTYASMVQVYVALLFQIYMYVYMDDTIYISHFSLVFHNQL